jgi:hypothetical protein
MRIVSAVLMAVFSPVACVAQTPAASGQAGAAAGQVPAAAAGALSSPAATNGPTSSSILQPSLDSVDRTATALKLDKWKRGSVRDEASSDVEKIVHDIHGSVPALLAAADAAPGAVSKALPVVRNVDALYDVLLRVYEASRVVAPADQVEQIEQALEELQKARLALYDRLQDTSALEEKQVADLQARVQEQAANKCPVIPPPAVPVCKPPTPARRPRKKPAAPKTTTPATPNATPSSGTASKPQN